MILMRRMMTSMAKLVKKERMRMMMRVARLTLPTKKWMSFQTARLRS